MVYEASICLLRCCLWGYRLAIGNVAMNAMQ